MAESLVSVALQIINPGVLYRNIWRSQQNIPGEGLFLDGDIFLDALSY